eukprot:5503810-Pyramimonas_sp.AAC.1
MIVKQSMEHAQDATSSEKSSIQQVLIKVMTLMGKITVNEFIEPAAVSQPLIETLGQPCLVSKKMRWQGIVFTAGAVVLIRDIDNAFTACVCVREVYALLAT